MGRNWVKGVGFVLGQWGCFGTRKRQRWCYMVNGLSTTELSLENGWFRVM